MAFTNTDRFGNQYTVVGLKPNKNGYPVGYLDAGSMLVKIEITTAKKEGVDYWCRLTKLKKNRNNMRSNTPIF